MGEALEAVDFGDLAEEPTLNSRWKPGLQELVYTAINYVRGDYEDADENNGEQIAEQLLIALRDAGRLLTAGNIARTLLQALEDHCAGEGPLGYSDHAKEGKDLRAEIQRFLAMTSPSQKTGQPDE